MKTNFIYIGKNESDRTPKQEFKAIRLTTRDKRKLHPQWSDAEIKSANAIYPMTFDDDGSVFVLGLGWKKATDKNTLTVPVFSGDVEDWDAYLSEYGEECLFYSLTGYSLRTHDCCAFNKQSEFLSLLSMDGGIVEYQKFASDILRIQEIQKQVLTEKLGWLPKYELDSFIKEVKIKPEFKIFFIVTPPYLDTPSDDDKLVTVYRKIRMREISSEDPDFERMCALSGSTSEEDRSEYRTLYDRIRKYAYEKATEEIEKEVFPCQMRARMEHLYGKELTGLYSGILDRVKEDETQEENSPRR